MRSSKKAFLLGFMTAFLSSCGGDGDGFTPSPPPPPEEIPITAGNAQDVVSTVVVSVVAVTDLGSILDTTPVAAADAANVAAKQVISGLRALKAGRVAVLQVPFGPETTACNVSGTVTVSGDLADPVTLTPGDTLAAEFDACDDGDGVLLDGAFDATIVEFSGDIDLLQALLTAAVQATALAITADGETVTVDGDFTFTIDTLSAPLVSLTVTGDSLTVASSLDTTTLEAFSQRQTQNEGAVPRPITFEAEGTLASTVLDGTVAYTTPLDFEAFDDDYPYAGELLVNGAADSSVRLVALDDTSVMLLVDEDGDGTIDETLDALWSAIWERPD